MREKFGKFVLLEEIATSGLGTEYRAVKVKPGGSPERLVSLTRLSPALSQNAKFVQALMAQSKAASLLLSPSLLKLVAIGRAESAYYLAYEHYDGKSLKAIFERTRRDRFPLAPDHALVILSKACAALEYAHGKHGEFGPHVHGFLAPSAVVVAHDGDVKLRGFGTWAAGIRDAGGIGADEWPYLAPEQAAGGHCDARSDVFTAGALLFEALTGQPLRSPQSEGGSKARIGAARLAAAHETGPLPPPLAEVIARATADDPAARFQEMEEMRRAVDALLFSGDYNPTTFNLAFFMHSLFREEIDREAKAVAEQSAASYADFAVDESSKPPGAPVPGPAEPVQPAPVPPAAAPQGQAPITAAPRTPTPPVSAQSAPAVRTPAAMAPAPAAAREAGAREAAPAAAAPIAAEVPEPPVLVDPTIVLTAGEPDLDGIRSALTMEDAPPPRPREPGSSPRLAGAPAAPLGAARDAARRATLPSGLGQGRRMVALAAAVVLVVALGSAAAWYYLAGPGAPRAVLRPPPTTLSPEATAALARVRDLEEKLRKIEQEKIEAEAEAVAEAKRKLEAQAAARGQRADPAAVQKAQEEARRQAQAEQERRQLEERRRLEQEQRAAEVQIAEERRRADAAAAAVPPPAPGAAAAPAAPSAAPPATTPPPTQAAAPSVASPAGAPPPAAESATRAGTLVNLSDLGVIEPVVERQAAPVYPEIARQRRIEGTVELNVLVDEKGNVTDVKLVRGSSGIGLNDAAIESVKRRKYRPATKDGVPVKVYVPVVVRFTLTQ